MKLKTLYLLLCLLGAIVPYCFFVSWLTAGGWAPRLFLSELFANRNRTFFALDLVISAAVFLIFLWRGSRARGMQKLFLPVLTTLLAGLSLGLPLFLYMREARGGAAQKAAAH